MPSSIPHLAFPYSVDRTGHGVELEQDTDDEIVNCVLLISTVSIGGLPDQPDFGITDPTFLLRPPLDVLAAQIHQWEDRAIVAAKVQPSDDDPSQTTIVFEVQTKGRH